MYKKKRASLSKTDQSTHFLRHIHKMYAIVPMYFTHTDTHLYIKYTLTVFGIYSICCRNWGFSFQYVIFMKTR